MLPRRDMAWYGGGYGLVWWLDACVCHGSTHLSLWPGMVAARVHASNFAPHTLSSPPTYGGMRTHGSRAMRTHASLCGRMRFRVASGGMLPGVLTCAIRLDSRGFCSLNLFSYALCAMRYICAPRHLSANRLFRELIRLSCSLIRLFRRPLLPYS